MVADVANALLLFDKLAATMRRHLRFSLPRLPVGFNIEKLLPAATCPKLDRKGLF